MKKTLTGKVLIVDDEEDILKILKLILGSFGLEVKTSGSGEEALALLKSEPFEYLITDLQMPKLGGEKVIQQSQELGMKHLKILVITGGDSAEFSAEQRQVIEKYAHGFLKKPFDRVNLYNSLSLINRCFPEKFTKFILSCIDLV